MIRAETAMRHEIAIFWASSCQFLNSSPILRIVELCQAVLMLLLIVHLKSAPLRVARVSLALLEEYS